MQLYNGDCLEVLDQLQEKSIDMVLCDLPYGTTKCKWDTVIPLDIMWEKLLRVCKNNIAIILFGSQPFTSNLIMSNIDMFKYEWIWEKSKASNFLLAKKQVLKVHENVIVFSNGVAPYYPQMDVGKAFSGKNRAGKQGSEWEGFNSVPNPQFRYDNNGTRYPRSVRYFKTAESEGKTHHPTQKPVELLEYLIKTYSKEDETILDFTMGSGSTGVACKNLNRSFIGIEKDEKYFEIAKNRIDGAS